MTCTQPDPCPRCGKCLLCDAECTCNEERPAQMNEIMTATTVRGRDVKVGDDLWFLGKPYRIARIEPYTDGPNATRPLSQELFGGQGRVGYSDSFGKDGKDAWAITLDPDGSCNVTRVSVKAAADG